MRSKLYPALLLLLSHSTANAQLVINEVDYDQPSTDDREYLELKNTGNTSIALQDVVVVMVNGAGGGAVIYATIGSPSWPSLAPGGYFVICANPQLTAECDYDASPDQDLIQNGSPDAIALVDITDSTVIDMLSYEGDVPGYTENVGFVDEDPSSGGLGGVNENKSLSRFPDGVDTGDNSVDFRITCSTPGAANVNDSTGCFSTSIAKPLMRLNTFLTAENDQLFVHLSDVSGAVYVDLFDMRGALLSERVGSAQGSFSCHFPVSIASRQPVMVVARSAEGVRTLRTVLP